MNSSPAALHIYFLRTVSLCCIVIVFGLGAGSLMGWIFDVSILKAPSFWKVEISPLVSINFILFSLALFYQYFKKPGNADKYIALVIITTSAFALLEKFFEFNFTLATRFFELAFNRPISVAFQSGMSVFLSVDFIICSVSLLLLKHDKKIILRQLLNLAALLIALIPLVCFINRVPEAQPYLLISPYAALGLMLTSIAMLFYNPQVGLIKEIIAESSGGVAARYLIPLALVFPIFLGHLRLRSQWASVVSSELSQTTLSLIIALLFAVMIWYVAYLLNRKHQLQTEKEKELAQLNLQLTNSLSSQAHLNEELQASLEKLKSSNEELIATNEKLEQARKIIAQQKDTQLRKNQQTLDEYRKNLEIIFNRTQDIFILIDRSLNIILFNKAAHDMSVEISGVALRTGSPYLNSAPVHRKEKLQNVLSQVLKGETITLSTDFTGISGTVIQYKVTYEPVIQNGEVTHITIGGTDLKEIRKQENELKQQRQTLEIIFKNSADNFVIIDREEKIVLFNESFRHFPEAMLGITPEVGMKIYDVLPLDRVEPSREIFKKVLQGERFDIEAKTLVNNTPRYFSVRYNPVVVEGEIKFASISAFDITERKLQELELEMFRQNLEIIFNNSSDNFLLMDDEANIILFNKEFKKFAETFVGVTPEIGMSLYHVVPPSRIEANRLMMSRVLAGEPVKDLGKVEHNGKTRYFEITYQPVFHDKLITHVTLSAFEVTEVTEYRLSLERKVEERTRELQAALAKEKEMVDIQKRFISVASHEFRTPLSTISLASGFIKKFQSKLSPEEVQKKLDSINAQVNWMNQLLQDVLTIGKIESGLNQLQWKDIELKKLFESIVVDVTSSISERHRINFSWQCRRETIKSDEGKIRQILINLLNNAIKFSKKDFKEIDLIVTCDRNHLLVSVKDYGVGIPEEDKNKLFQPFYRASNVANIAGTGLGLAIVFKAVETLGGKIEVQSAVNEGTEFIVLLPLK